MTSNKYVGPEPIVHDDGSVEYPVDPDFEVVEIPEQDLTPVEVDDEDYIPAEGDDLDG